MSDGEQPPTVEKIAADIVDDETAGRISPTEIEFKFPTLEKPKVAIVGFALGTVHKAPYTDDGVEKWGLNQLWKVTDKKFDRWFELHSLWEFYHANPGHQQFLRDFKGPVYVREEDYSLALEWGIETAQPFPHRLILDNFRPYFTNTVSWLVALAIMMRPEWLGLYGIDMAVDHLLAAEYSEQRPSAEYYLGIAEGTGIELHIPNGCDLMGATALYGYEDSGRVLEKMSSRFTELETNKQQLGAQVQQLDAQAMQAKLAQAKMAGAQEEVSYWRKNWLTLPATEEG